MRFTLALIVSVLALASLPALAEASPNVKYGIQDDAWLEAGPGTIDDRIAELKRLGVQVYRFTLRWDEVATRRPARPANHNDPAYDWRWADTVIRGLRAQGIAPVVTIYGTPRWANGRRGPNFAPGNKAAFGSFARAAATRYRAQVKHWVIWNEPNQRRWLRPTTPRAYVNLLNAAYTQIKKVNRGARVAGGVTAPRGNTGGMNPVNWIIGMRAAKAKLDAYAHHPYPTRPGVETPWSGGCGRCKTITMAELDRLVRTLNQNFPRKRIWLTEYAYQTNPPERFLGVSFAKQATYHGGASLRAFQTPRVDMLIHFLMRDDRRSGGWQSGLRRLNGQTKPSYNAFRLPLAQVSRSGTRTRVWGQVRPRSGRQPYRLQVRRGGRWVWVGRQQMTTPRGFFQRTIAAGKGTKVRIWSPRDRVFSPPLTVR